MKQTRSWENYIRTDSQEIARILSNPKIHYRAHSSLPPVPIMSQPNPVHTLIPYFPTTHFNINVTTTPTPLSVLSLDVFQPKYYI